jgi:hypothetical protein
MLLAGMSQRQIAAELTRLKVPTASEWDHENKYCQKNGTKAWNQTQVARLLKAMSEVLVKMKWYYVHAHREFKNALRSDTWDGSVLFISPVTGDVKSRKLTKHKRKTPGEHYRSKVWSLRVEQMENAGYNYSSDTMEELELSWKRFLSLQSYHRRKNRRAAEKASGGETL